jgi:hypothetical protein
MQYGVERLKNAFKSAYMTYNPQSLYFAGATWLHGLRALYNPVGYAHMAYMMRDQAHALAQG